jgi:chromosome segregation ATPase
MLCMDTDSNHDAIARRVERLNEAMAEIRRAMERLMAENQRMREVIRLAESELRKRRDQVQNLENEIHGLQNDRLEAKARVEHAMEKLDELMAQTDNSSPQ